MNRSNFKYLILTLLLNILSAQKVKEGNFTPVVFWHGMACKLPVELIYDLKMKTVKSKPLETGDSCCFSFSLGAIKNKLEETLPGIYVLSLRIGDSEVKDVENGYFLHPNKQIKMACDMVSADPLLTDGFNAIGFSQGAQFLRALVQRCPTAKIRNLISLGGQHQGVYGLPNCGSLSSTVCDYFRRMLNHAAYLRWLQKSLVQATYWHDPLNEQEYKNYSTFLSDINNELAINQQYVDRLQTLDNFVLVQFENDTIVEPVATEWFGFYKPGQSKEIQTLQESTIYTEDRLGLRKLDENSKLHFLTTPGNHLQFEWPWFKENIIDLYLKN